MSRIGKQPIAIPDGVTVTIEGQNIKVVGALGTKELTINENIIITREDNVITLSRRNEERKTSALHGLSRTLLANAINGVKNGFEKKLEIVGVGYRANMQGTALNLQLGYSHPVVLEPPTGVSVVVEANTKITIKGFDKQLVGDFAALVRSKRPPEVYKGKGIKYEGEYIRRKAGKTGKK